MSQGRKFIMAMPIELICLVSHLLLIFCLPEELVPPAIVGALLVKKPFPRVDFIDLVQARNEEQENS